MLQHVRGFLTNQPSGVRLPDTNYSRLCSGCKTELPADRKSHYCKPCVAQKQAEYRERNPEKAKASTAKWKAKNKAHLKAEWAEWYKANKRQKLADGREWRKNNPDRVRELSQIRAKENPDLMRQYWRNRRARKLNAGGSHTASDILDLLKSQKSTCTVCRKSLQNIYHVDHIQPLAKGGSNDKTNLQILCPPCNLSKNARDPLEFMQSRGFLL